MSYEISHLNHLACRSKCHKQVRVITVKRTATLSAWHAPGSFAKIIRCRCEAVRPCVVACVISRATLLPVRVKLALRANERPSKLFYKNGQGLVQVKFNLPMVAEPRGSPRVAVMFAAPWTHQGYEDAHFEIATLSNLSANEIIISKYLLLEHAPVGIVRRHPKKYGRLGAVSRTLWHNESTRVDDWNNVCEYNAAKGREIVSSISLSQRAVGSVSGCQRLQVFRDCQCTTAVGKYACNQRR
jgi:hypothetical protein